MDIILNTHSLNRYLLAVFAIYCIIRLLRNVVGKHAFTSADAQTLRWFSTLMTIQFALGLVLFVKDGINVSWSMHELRPHLEHAVTMLLALGLSHATASARKKDPLSASSRALIFISASLLLIVVGVVRLKGLEFWFGG